MTITKDENRDAMRRLLHYEGDYLGLHELAFILGLTKQATSNRRRRGKLPEPVQELAMSPIWSRSQIAEYLCNDP